MIKLYSYFDPQNEGAVRLGGTYFHGTIQSVVAPHCADAQDDLVAWFPDPAVGMGEDVHEVDVYGTRALAFFWWFEWEIGGRQLRGYVVDPNDHLALESAIRLMEERPTVI